VKIVLAIDPDQPVAAYRDALLAAGAAPGEVEVVQPGDELPVEFDGLLLAGGVDVDPSRYGEPAWNGTVETNAGRDAIDFELFDRARRIGAPVFGICRGLQVVNVALGGTLWQDLPTQRPRGVPHAFPRRDGHDPAHPAHSVRVALGARPSLPLAGALRAADGVRVNSRHHQAVKELAPGLVPLVASPDDLVEALAHEEGPFLAAVQWHPENLVGRADQRALFDEFLGAARARAARRPEAGAKAPILDLSAVPSGARARGPARDEGDETAPRGPARPATLAAPPGEALRGAPETT
jgi:putative glutamine amidotransferase